MTCTAWGHGRLWVRSPIWVTALDEMLRFSDCSVFSSSHRSQGDTQKCSQAPNISFLLYFEEFNEDTAVWATCWDTDQNDWSSAARLMLGSWQQRGQAPCIFPQWGHVHTDPSMLSACPACAHKPRMSAGTQQLIPDRLAFPSSKHGALSYSENFCQHKSEEDEKYTFYSVLEERHIALPSIFGNNYWGQD